MILTLFHQIYRSRINLEEMRSGMKSNKPKDVTFHQAVDDPETRGEFIRRQCSSHLSVLIVV